MERLALGVEAGREWRLEGVDGLLRQPLRPGSSRRSSARRALASSSQASSSDDAGDEPRLLGLAAVEEAAREDDVHRLRLADRPRQPLRAAGSRDDAEVRLGLPELRASRRRRSGRRPSRARSRRPGSSPTRRRRAAS